MIKKKRYRVIDIPMNDQVQLQKYEWEVYLLIRYNHTLENIQTKLSLNDDDAHDVIGKLTQIGLIEEVCYSFSEFKEKYYPSLDLAVERHRVFTFQDVKDFINRKIGTGKNAEMALFRILLAIPPRLLQDAGIHSIKNISGDISITDKHLISKLNQSIQKVVGEPLLTA